MSPAEHQPTDTRHAERPSSGAQNRHQEGASYYGQPVIKEPVWTWEIPCYFFTGGLGGASAGLAYAAHLTGQQEIERRAWALSLAATAVSPLLLISDLGKPSRFLNMLRMFKVTSPMSVGSWVLAASGTSSAVACAGTLLGLLPKTTRIARPAAAVLGLPLATYTAALISNTAVPVWHEARRELPFLFAAGSAASAGGLTSALTPPAQAATARRLAIAGAAAELLATELMERHLGELATPYEHDHAGVFSRLAKSATVAGACTLLAGRRSRKAAIAGGITLAAGAFFERWSVFRAGFQSASDPQQVVGPQRQRVRDGQGHGAVT